MNTTINQPGMFMMPMEFGPCGGPRRRPDGRRFVFLLSYLAQPQTIRLRGGASYTDRLTGRALAETETLEPYGVLVLESL